MTTRAETPLDTLAHSYVASLVEASPLFASATGLADTADLDDFSPAGLGKLNDLNVSTLHKVTGLEPVDHTDRVTKASMLERLGSSIRLFEAGETIGEINPLASPLQQVRDSFDQMGTSTDEEVDRVAHRAAQIPATFAGYQESLRWRAAAGPAIPIRQIKECVKQAELMLGEGGLFSDLEKHGIDVAPGRTATADLIETYRSLPTTDVDAVGRDRYAPLLADYLGTNVDLDETYDWGLDQLAHINSEQEAIIADLYGPGVSVAEAIDRLNNDPARQAHGRDNLKEWMQATADEAIAGLGQHFDIPDKLRTCEAMVLYPGTGGIYYTGPTQDFSRPGRMWWSVPEGVDTFNLWQEKTTVYHEGVPGHHLQIGYAVLQSDTLNDWRRHACWVSGHGEGWALYSERLMADLGFLDDPGDYFGMLDSQRLRAARVVLDIGVHVKGWDTDKAWQFLLDNVAMDRSFLAFEFTRYLGWPGQAPSYKIGQRVWEEQRDRALASGMSIKDFHHRALSQGAFPLEVFDVALSR